MQTKYIVRISILYFVDIARASYCVHAGIVENYCGLNVSKTQGSDNDNEVPHTPSS